MCCPALLAACGNHSGEAEHDSGIGLILFGFIAEPVFTFIPESCSRSSRNTVRNHPGIAFILPRIPQKAPDLLTGLSTITFCCHQLSPVRMSGCLKMVLVTKPTWP